jgi:hypothetical protein
MKYDANEVLAMLESLILETTIGRRTDGEESVTFQVRANELPAISLKKALTYGFQRWINDRVGGKDTTLKAKIDDTSIFLAKVKDGSWYVEGKTRAATVDLFTKFAREYVKAIVVKKDPAKLDGLKGEELAAYLDGVFASNDAKLRPAIQAKVDAEMARRAEAAKLADDIEL